MGNARTSLTQKSKGTVPLSFVTTAQAILIRPLLADAPVGAPATGFQQAVMSSSNMNVFEPTLTCFIEVLQYSAAASSTLKRRSLGAGTMLPGPPSIVNVKPLMFLASNAA